MYTKLYDAFVDSNGREQIQKFLQVRPLTDEFMESINITPELYYDPKRVEQDKELLLEFMSYINALIDKSNHQTTIAV